MREVLLIGHSVNEFVGMQKQGLHRHAISHNAATCGSSRCQVGLSRQTKTYLATAFDHLCPFTLGIPQLGYAALVGSQSSQC